MKRGNGPSPAKIQQRLEKMDQQDAYDHVNDHPPDRGRHRPSTTTAAANRSRSSSATLQAVKWQPGHSRDAHSHRPEPSTSSGVHAKARTDEQLEKYEIRPTTSVPKPQSSSARPSTVKTHTGTAPVRQVTDAANRSSQPKASIAGQPFAKPTKTSKEFTDERRASRKDNRRTNRISADGKFLNSLKRSSFRTDRSDTESEASTCSQPPPPPPPPTPLRNRKKLLFSQDRTDTESEASYSGEPNKPSPHLKQGCSNTPSAAPHVRMPVAPSPAKTRPMAVHKRRRGDSDSEYLEIPSESESGMDADDEDAATKSTKLVEHNRQKPRVHKERNRHRRKKRKRSLTPPQGPVTNIKVTVNYNQCASEHPKEHAAKCDDVTISGVDNADVAAQVVGGLLVKCGKELMDKRSKSVDRHQEDSIAIEEEPRQWPKNAGGSHFADEIASLTAQNKMMKTSDEGAPSLATTSARRAAIVPPDEAGNPQAESASSPVDRPSTVDGTLVTSTSMVANNSTLSLPTGTPVAAVATSTVVPAAESQEQGRRAAGSSSEGIVSERHEQGRGAERLSNNNWESASRTTMSSNSQAEESDDETAQRDIVSVPM